MDPLTPENHEPMLVGLFKCTIGAFVLSGVLEAITNWGLHLILHGVSGLAVGFLVYWAQNYWFPFIFKVLAKKFPRLFPTVKNEKK